MPNPDDKIIDQITAAAVPLPEVNPPNRPSLTGRRRPAVDWQRINGPPIVQRRGFWGWVGFALTQFAKWTALLILTPLACYVVAGLIGALIAVNSDFQNATDGIEVFIYSGNAHSELIVPLGEGGQDWAKTFSLPPPSKFDPKFSHIAIGWGDRNFYTQTERWSDVTLSTAAKAFFLPTRSVLHVQPVAAPYVSSRSMRVKLSPKQYTALCQSIQSSIADPVPIAGESFGQQDFFYPATEKFHLFNTCNNWVGEKMKAAEIKVGRFTPLPKTVFWHLDN